MLLAVGGKLEASAFLIHDPTLCSPASSPIRGHLSRPSQRGLLFLANTDDDDSAMEKTWRSLKKPLISIGAKGVSQSHGNSLRQLLEAHTAIKVKVRGLPLETAFDQLVDAAQSVGAPGNLELLQSRSSDAIMMIGLPGTRERIAEGTFPNSK